MSQQILQTSAHFRANLGVLNEAAAQEFSKWASLNCIHHVMQKENGSTVLYATRPNARSSQQHKNTLRALSSRNNIKLQTEPSFLRLLHEEYAVTGGEASVEQKNAPSLREGAIPTSCKMEIVTQLPEGFDAHAGALLSQLVAASA